MKYMITTIEFFKENWEQIKWMAGLAAGLWQAAIALASKLAQKWDKSANQDKS